MVPELIHGLSLDMCSSSVSFAIFFFPHFLKRASMLEPIWCLGPGYISGSWAHWSGAHPGSVSYDHNRGREMGYTESHGTQYGASFTAGGEGRGEARCLAVDVQSTLCGPMCLCSLGDASVSRAPSTHLPAERFSPAVLPFPGPLTSVTSLHPLVSPSSEFLE